MHHFCYSGSSQFYTFYRYPFVCWHWSVEFLCIIWQNILTTKFLFCCEFSQVALIDITIQRRISTTSTVRKWCIIYVQKRWHKIGSVFFVITVLCMCILLSAFFSLLLGKFSRLIFCQPTSADFVCRFVFFCSQASAKWEQRQHSLFSTCLISNGLPFTIRAGLIVSIHLKSAPSGYTSLKPRSEKIFKSSTTPIVLLQISVQLR